jgi:hypothetical protein
MTYRDIVLKLLKTRGDLVCLEQHLMSDFSENSRGNESFLTWCQSHGIEYARVQQEEPSKIYLKRKYHMENN